MAKPLPKLWNFIIAAGAFATAAAAVQLVLHGGDPIEYALLAFGLLVIVGGVLGHKFSSKQNSA